jgi:AbiU2
LRILDDLAWELLALHANNQHLGYSLELSRKIPKSHAAKAFLSLRTSMGRYELVRIASLWDNEDQFGINIPTVVGLINDPKVLEKLENDEYARHAFSCASGPPMEDWAEALSKKIQKEFATERKSKLSATIEKTIPEIERFRQNRRLKALQNARNKHLAHNLTTTDLEWTCPEKVEGLLIA